MNHNETKSKIVQEMHLAQSRLIMISTAALANMGMAECAKELAEYSHRVLDELSNAVCGFSILLTHEVPNVHLEQFRTSWGQIADRLEVKPTQNIDEALAYVRLLMHRLSKQGAEVSLQVVKAFSAARKLEGASKLGTRGAGL